MLQASVDLVPPSKSLASSRCTDWLAVETLQAYAVEGAAETINVRSADHGLVLCLPKRQVAQQLIDSATCISATVLQPSLWGAGTQTLAVVVYMYGSILHAYLIASRCDIRHH